MEQDQINTEYNLDEEYKPDPLIPQGNYLGSVTAVGHKAESYCITWSITLADNGGLMSDGQTPIDGGRVFARNWLPKPSDENEMTSDGRKTKRQSKINMLKDFAAALEVDMNTPAMVNESIANGDWVGIPVTVAVGISEYQGRTRNEVGKVERRTEDE